MLVFLLLLLLGSTTAVGYCSMSGCANVTQCTCPPFFFDCIVQNDRLGVCSLTESGTWIIGFLALALAILVLLLVGFLCCCCCCKYRGRKEVHHYASKEGGPHNI